MHKPRPYADGLVQERRNSTANALELRLSCTNPSICMCLSCTHTGFELQKRWAWWCHGSNRCQDIRRHTAEPRIRDVSHMISLAIEIVIFFHRSGGMNCWLSEQLHEKLTVVIEKPIDRDIQCHWSQSVCADAGNHYSDQRNHLSSTSLAFVRGIHRWPVNSPHKWPVTRKMFPFNDVMILTHCLLGEVELILHVYVLNSFYKIFFELFLWNWY